MGLVKKLVRASNAFYVLKRKRIRLLDDEGNLTDGVATVAMIIVLFLWLLAGGIELGNL